MNKKKLIENRNDLQEKMQAIVDKAKAENRAMTNEEITEFDGYEQNIKDIDSTLKRIDIVDKLENKHVDEPETQEAKDVKAFANYIRGRVNPGTIKDDATQLTKGDNGAVIPKTIIQKIIEKVQELSPVYQLATKYNIGGTINIPKEDDSTDKITVAYATEFTDLTSHSNKFATIELTGYLYGALTKISKSLLRNSDFNLTNWVINKMSKKIAAFIEGECINGTADKVSGIAGSYDNTNMKLTLAKKSEITADELIDLQELVPDAYQANCIWLMNKATRKAIRKLKDGQGNYILERDTTSKWSYKLFDKDIYVSDNIKGLGEAAKNVIYYGDISGLAVKETESAEIEILTETFATQHAIGVVAWGEIDAKVEDTQKISVAVTPSK